MKVMLIMLVLNAHTGAEISRKPLDKFFTMEKCMQTVVGMTVIISTTDPPSIELPKCIDLEEKPPR